MAAGVLAQAFDAELEQQLAAMPPHYRAASSYDHWIRGAYLITAVSRSSSLTARPLFHMISIICLSE